MKTKLNAILATALCLCITTLRSLAAETPPVITPAQGGGSDNRLLPAAPITHTPAQGVPQLPLAPSITTASSVEELLLQAELSVAIQAYRRSLEIMSEQRLKLASMPDGQGDKHPARVTAGAAIINLQKHADTLRADALRISADLNKLNQRR